MIRTACLHGSVTLTVPNFDICHISGTLQHYLFVKRIKLAALKTLNTIGVAPPNTASTNTATPDDAAASVTTTACGAAADDDDCDGSPASASGTSGEGGEDDFEPAGTPADEATAAAAAGNGGGGGVPAGGVDIKLAEGAALDAAVAGASRNMDAVLSPGMKIEYWYNEEYGWIEAEVGR